MRAFLFGALAVWLAAPVAGLRAQPQPPPESSYGELLFVGETQVEVVVEDVTRVVVGDSQVTIVGSQGATTYCATNDGGVLLALLKGPRVSVVHVPVVEGRLGTPSVARRVERRAVAERVPVGAAIAPMPDGFAVFWQEADTRNPSAAYDTWVRRVSAEGEPLAQTVRVNAVWPLAAAAYLADSNRFYFLLFYGGGSGPRGTRLCGVHVDAATWRPREHPWWASRPGLIDEARLFVRGSRVTALYRGGGEGDRLLEVDVSEGQWARQARPGRPRARLGPTALFGGRLVGDDLRVVTQAAPTPADGSGR